MIIRVYKAGTMTSGNRNHAGIPGKRGGSAKSRKPVDAGKLTIKSNSKIATNLDTPLRRVRLQNNFTIDEIDDMSDWEQAGQLAYMLNNHAIPRRNDLAKLQGFDGETQLESGQSMKVIMYNDTTSDASPIDSGDSNYKKFGFSTDSKTIEANDIEDMRQTDMMNLYLDVNAIEAQHLVNNPNLDNLSSKEWKEKKLELAIISQGMREYAILHGYDAVTNNGEVGLILNKTKLIELSNPDATPLSFVPPVPIAVSTPIATVKKGKTAKKDKQLPEAPKTLEGLASQTGTHTQVTSAVAQLMIDNEVEISKALGKPMREYIQEIESGLKQQLEGAEFTSHCPLSAIQGIKDNGLLNTFQLQERGMVAKTYDKTYLNTRKRTEELNGVPRKTKGDDRPQYGSLNLTNGYNSDNTGYGEVQLVLDDSIRDRSAFTMGDSWGRRDYVRASSINDPSLFSTGFSQFVDNNVSLKYGSPSQKVKSIVDGLTIQHNRARGKAPFANLKYIEFQTFGGIKGSDIKKVRLPAYYKFTPYVDQVRGTFGDDMVIEYY